METRAEQKKMEIPQAPDHSSPVPGPGESWDGRSFQYAAIFWTILLALVAGYDYHSTYNALRQNAETAARYTHHHDLIVRNWASGHGGVYVPISEQTQPNPYLNHPEREIITPSGRRLTLLNPAYITRQLHELAKESSQKVHGHITSLEPIRPQNAPDSWEILALQAFERGESEFAELTTMAGERYFRLMKPLLVQQSCLICHPEAKLDGIRGGISVAIPWQSYQQLLEQRRPFHILGYGGIWLTGLLGIWLTWQQQRDQFNRLDRNEQKLSASEERYRLLAESATSTIPWEYDPILDRWSYLAPQVAEILGYQPEEWSDFNFWAERIHPDDRQGAVTLCRRAAENGESHTMEYRFRKKGGGYAWLRDVASVEVKEGRPVRLRGVLIDLSEHRVLEEKLRQSAKMEAVGTLAAGVAHDFNNILTSLISFATLLKRRHQEDTLSQDYLQEILNGSKRAAELTRSLLAYSRKLEVKITPEELNQIVGQSQKMLRRLIREDIEIKVEPGPDELPVLVDRTQIEQVLMNLAGNAQDAMPDGGTLTITTRRSSPEEHRDPASPLHELAAPCAVLTIEDSGTGIKPEDLERLFEPFFTTKAVGRGTGLGLPLVLGVVQQHGGTITVSSQLQVGSRFTIFLPLRDPSRSTEEQVDPSLTPVAENGAAETLLLIEDDQQVRQVLQRILAGHQYRVLTAADGDEAISLFRAHQREIALVISDVIMPGKNGREVYQELRAINPEVKALFISGYPADIINLEELHRLNLQLLAKPVMPDELLAKVAEIIKQTP